MNTEGDGATTPDDLTIPKDTLDIYMDTGFSKKDAIAHYNKLYNK